MHRKTNPIAIVGAGVSGLAAAFELASEGYLVRIFEKSRGLSGRAASRSREGCRYDHGANYFHRPEGELADLLFKRLPTRDLIRVEGAILPFDGEGRLQASDPERKGETRWNYGGGISTLGKLLVESAGLAVEGGSRVLSMERGEGGAWFLSTEEGERHGPFGAVIATLPAPQAVELLAASSFDPEAKGRLRESLARVRYQSQFSVVMNFAAEFSLPGGAYALINPDRLHPVAWLGHENRKPGRIPSGQSVLVAQMSPHWTARHDDEAPDLVAGRAYEAVRALLSDADPQAAIRLPSPRWSDCQRWRYALPIESVPPGTLELAEALGLYFAGDSLLNKGRVLGAIGTGLDAARRLAGRS